MRKLLLGAVLLWCGMASAQSHYVRTWSSGGGCQAPTAMCYFVAVSASSVVAPATSALTLTGSATDGASAVALILNSGVALTTSGAKLFSLRNNGVEKASFDKDGTLDTLKVQPSTTNGTLTLMGNGNNSASVGVVVDNVANLGNSNNRHLSIRNAGAELMYANTGGFFPGTTNTRALGSSGLMWATSYVTQAYTLSIWSTSNNAARIAIPNNQANTYRSEWDSASTNDVAHKFVVRNAFAGAMDLLGVYSNDGTTKVFSVYKDGSTKQAGVATGSLATCNSGNKGLESFDTTLTKPVWCDGSTYRSVPHHLSFDGTQDPGSLSAQTCTDFTISATGVVDGDVASCDAPSGLEAGLLATCNTGTDVIGWRVCNVTAGAIDPGNGAYRARVIR